jgi:hypothetical protein
VKNKRPEIKFLLFADAEKNKHGKGKETKSTKFCRTDKLCETRTLNERLRAENGFKHDRRAKCASVDIRGDV